MARTVSFDGIGMGSYVTFTQGATGFTRGTHENWPAKVSANGAVSIAASGNQFIGIVRIIDPHGDVVSVQESGYITLPYGTGTMALGQLTLEADGAGAVNQVAAAAGKKSYYVVSIDATATTITFKL